MSELDQVIEAYRSGDADDATLESTLKAHLAEHPDAAPALEIRLKDLFMEGLLPESIYQSLTVTVVSSDATDSEVELPPGTMIRDRFVLEEVIGRGGMSVVYRARDRRREEANDRHSQIAIKFLGHQFKDHPAAYVTLQREARRAQQLAHPNIATVFDFDREGDIPYLCMELLTGRALSDVLRYSTSPDLDAAQHIIEGMADGLEYAHRQGIVHADFKPGNVFVGDGNEVKILDFGIARVVPDRGNETVFDAGQLGALTPSYASCEMFDKLEPDPRDDIYALACVSYELLTGEHPFQRRSAPEARQAALSPAPVAGLSRRQNRALRRGLAFDRASRTASARTFYEELFAVPAAGSRLRSIAAVVGISAAGAMGIWIYTNDSGPPRSGESAEPTGGNQLEPAVADPAAGNQPDSGAGPGAATQDTGSLGTESATPSDIPSVVDAATKERIDRILFIADLHRQVDKLVTPPGTNAAEAYADAIRLQPGNPEALQGLTAVADALVEKTRMLEQMGDRRQALELVVSGLGYMPEHAGLLSMKAELESPED